MKRIMIAFFLTLLVLLIAFSGYCLDQNIAQKQAEQKAAQELALEIALQEEIATAAYIGNKNTQKFHLLDCSFLPALENRVYFEYRAQAIEDGFSPCQHCNP